MRNNFIHQRKDFLIPCIAMLLVFGIGVHVNAQITEGGTYQMFTCKDRTETYVYYGGTNDPAKIYCAVTWTVTGGVFVDHQNATSVGVYSDPSTAISSMKVKWTTDNPTGTIAVTHTGCYNGTSSKTITFQRNPTTIAANPSPVPAGNQVTLTATPTYNHTTSTWTATANGNLNQTTGLSVTANPVVNSEYTNKIVFNASLQINFQTVKTISCTETTKKTVPVSNSNITGNTICCEQCITSGQTPSSLGQASGSTLGGAPSFTFQWQRSTNGTDFTNIAGATSQSYPPGAITQSTWYKRVVNLGSPSNIIKVTVLPQNLTVNTASYSQNTLLVAANDITVQGIQTVSSGVQLTIKAGNRIVLQPETRLMPNTVLSIGSSCGGGGGGGHLAIIEDYGELKSVDSNNLSVYPNPANRLTTIKYKVASKGFVKLSIADGKGVILRTIYENYDVEPGVYEASFDVSTLTPGLYFYSLVASNQRESRKIVVSK